MAGFIALWCGGYFAILEFKVLTSKLKPPNLLGLGLRPGMPQVCSGKVTVN